MQIRVEEICRELEKVALQGNREDWGEESERIFQTLEAIIFHFGKEILYLNVELPVLPKHQSVY